MNLEAIAQYVAAKVGRTDAYAITLANKFTISRHRLVYEAFDWKSAQTVVSVTVTTENAPDDIEVVGLDKIISVRYNGKFIDPVLTQFIFDTRPELLDATGEPEFYTENYDQSSGIRKIRLFPRPGPDQLAPPQGTGVGEDTDETPAIENPVILILGKLPFNELALAVLPQVPYVEAALIAFVEADMLSWLHQYGKGESKLKEANENLEKAKEKDTPPAARPRQSKVLTVSGNSLEELTDSVCSILGLWDPITRISVKEYVRRNYQTLWEVALWPESTVVARVSITNNEQIILPHYFDRVISVRPDDGSIQQLRNAEISLFFNIDPQIFERDENPVYFSVISPTAVSVLPPYTEPITCILWGNGSCEPLRPHMLWKDETTKVFFKGEGYGLESTEELVVHTMPPAGGPCYLQDIINHGATTQNAYDVPLTLSKSPTVNRMDVYGTYSKRLLLTLSPTERERKHMRIWLLPNRHSEFNIGGGETDLQPTYLILGKRKMSPLVSDNDTCQLRNVENILINGAAADMLTKSDPALSKEYRAKAGELLKVLIAGETEHNAHEPTITPYVEPTYQLR